MLRSLALLVGLTALLAGCGGGSLSVPPTSIDPVELVKILPTPPGLDQSSDVTTVDAAELQATLAGVAKAESAKVYQDIGFAGGGHAHVVGTKRRPCPRGGQPVARS